MSEVRSHSAGPGATETKRYDVLRIDPPHGPLYLLVDSMYTDDEDANREITTFAYEESICPNDILARCKDVIVGGDTDPHHIIDYVKTIEVTWNYPCNPEEVLRPLIPEAFADIMPDDKDRIITDALDHLKETAAWFRNNDLGPLAELHEKMLSHFEKRHREAR